MESFEALVSRYERLVYSVARQIVGNDHDAQDVTQQALISAVEHLDTFRGDASFKTWLLRITTHAALKVVRKRKGLDTVSLEQHTESSGEDESIPHPEFISDWRQSPEKLVHQNETRQLLAEALEQLDEKHRAVFVLRDVEGLSVIETAKVLDISEANVKVRLLRARLQLRELLTRAFGDEEHRVRPHSHAHHK
jgi:RNA polymerase sigma-70 factor (ECF subfamily)